MSMTPVIRKEKFTVSLATKSYTYEVARFVVNENIKHHTDCEDLGQHLRDIEKVYTEEASYEDKIMYVAHDNQGELIGCIRVFKWNGNLILPIEKEFGVSLHSLFSSDQKMNFWHVGRFAISKTAGQVSIELFKLLMELAITPIVNDPENSCMIAETDCHLLRVMNKLGMNTRQLAESRYYLESETVPIVSMKSDLMYYYNKNSYLAH